MSSDSPLPIARLREAAVDFPLPVVLTTADFDVCSANEPFLSMLGLDLNDIVGAALAALREEGPTLAPGQFSRSVAEYRDSFGDLVRVESLGIPLFDDDRWVGHAWIETPTTGEGAHAGGLPGLAESLRSTESLLKQSKQLYRELYENSTDLIQSTNAQGRLVFVNDAWMRTLGYSEDQVLDLSMESILGSKHQHLVGLFRCEGGPERQSIRATFVTANGQKRWVEGTLSCRFVEERAVGTHSIFRDVTERERLDRMKAQFVSMVNHELRTPLTSIVGSLSLIAEGVTGPIPDETKRFAQIALRNAERLERLVDEVLDFEKLSVGKLRVSPRDVQLPDFVHGVVEDHQGLALARGVTIEDATEEVALSTDPDLLRHVVGNFLANAIRYTRAGGVVTVGATARGDVVRLWVHDDGPGVPRTIRDRVFEAFEQDEESTGGAGLGLHIANSMAHLLRGSVGYVSAIDCGTTFFVDFASDRRHPDPIEIEGDASCDVIRAVGREPGATLRLHGSQERVAMLLRDLATSPVSLRVILPGDYSGVVPARAGLEFVPSDT